MRGLLLATTILVTTSAAAFAQSAPVFRSVTEDSSLQLPASAPRVEAPTAAPAPAASPAQTLSQPNTTIQTQRPLPVSRSGETIDSVGNGAIPSLSLEATETNGIAYVSGGISDEEIDQLKANEDAFNLQIRITGSYGEFVSDVAFTLQDASGTTLATITDAGPYVYFRVPAGSYQATISANGTNKTLRLKIITGKTVKQTVGI